MKRTSIFRTALYMSLLVGMISACGSIDLDLESTPTEDPGLEQEELHPGLLQALQTTLDYLQATFPEAAPANPQAWEATNITPAGLVGSSSYRFQIEDWQIEIDYPIVAPESMIYYVTAEHTTSDLRWEGTIDADGQIIGSSATMQAVAWPGRVIGGTQADDLQFEITGEVGTVGLTSSDPDLLARLQAIRDDTGPQGFVHVWGTLDCSSTSDRQCSLEVTRVRSGTEITDPEPVTAWEGILFTRTGPPSSGGDDWFTLVGDWPIQYGIWALDETLRSELESLRDTGQAIRIWGELTVGIPDWNSTQINVSEFELVE